MTLERILQTISEASTGICASIQNKDTLSALNLRRSARLPVLASLCSQLNCPTLYLTDRFDRALKIANELSVWDAHLPQIVFPEPTPLFYENAPWGETTRRDRLLALTNLCAAHIQNNSTNRPSLIIAPARALMTRTIPPGEFRKASQLIEVGLLFQPNALMEHLLTLGYEHDAIVIAPGRYARRGGIIDIWPPSESQPVRIEFFGDEVETIRHFDPTTQRSDQRPEPETTKAVLLTPAREYLTQLKDSDLTGENPLSEFHIPLLHGKAAGILDYLPKSSLVLFDNRQPFEDAIDEFEAQALKLRQDYLDKGTLEANFPIPYLTKPEILDSLSLHVTVDLGPPGGHEFDARPLSSDSIRTNLNLSSRFSSGSRYGGRLKPFMDDLTEMLSQKKEVVVVSRQAARLKELWDDRNFSTPSRSLFFVEGSLTEGFIFETNDGSFLNLFTDGEIFGWRRPVLRRRIRPIAEAPEAVYTDLQIDDWVVHVDHGIGKFKGLVMRSMEDIEREYLCVEYEDEAELYVPVHQADRLTRYVGSDGRFPALSRLGGVEWRRSKIRVKEAVQEVAEDLLDLYAQRSIVNGFSFSPDSEWQGELETSFPYIETDDQIQVLGEVKIDMEAPRPMDRLICGDVGYGKTEVALRAAFKAVMDNKQVAMLVPTTVLAQQHYNTFKQRLAAYPVVVEMLSRFRTSAQQRNILHRTSEGKVDIVVGTHRLLSTDVGFKDLGLLIIDEEQRFGVTHKEAFKKMRKELDVLTLTATPIPRTLYMALSGVRDISTINTPPEERLPIITHVGPYSPRLIRQAVLRELERGGQIFFVHNRVQTIEGIKYHLRKLVPEARVGVAHGQMAENELSNRMHQFTEGEIDILLSTSIIESGLDIPNANTLIVDRADTFGLAQLYQLRGRVGRGALRAYAYFFRHKRKTPTLEGMQRMETIAENTQLGAGYSIAMRDLEIRGTGDILGTRQHGHIATVGFYLYTRLLSDSVRLIKAERDQKVVPFIPSGFESPILVNIDLPLQVGIPTNYVQEKDIRLGLYRRMADIRTMDEINALEEEFCDRFNIPPKPVLNLFYQFKVKLLAQQAGLSSINVENGQLVLRYPDEKLPSVLPDLIPDIRIGKFALWLPYKKLPDWRFALIETLESLHPREEV